MAGLALPVVGYSQALPAAPDDAPLEEIVVSASGVPTPVREVGAAVSVITDVEMQLRGYNSLADIMRTQPAIGVTNLGGVGKETSVRIRGEEGYRTVLMIDGVKAIDPSSTQAAPSFGGLLTTTDLQRVEVLRGPQGFVYGADAGGVVNIMTRQGEGDPSARLGLEYGEFATRKVDGSVSGGTDTIDYFVSATDLETDGFNARASDNVTMDDDGAENTTLHAKIGWQATDDLRLQLVARDIDASAQFDGCFDLVSFTTVHDCLSRTEQTTYRLSAEHDSERFTNSVGYSAVDITRDNLALGVRSFGAEGSIARFRYIGTYELSDSTTIVYGTDLQNEEAFTNGALQERKQDGYFAEYQGAFNDSLFVSLGTRYDDNEDFGSATSTRVSAAYVQDLGGSSLKYRATYGTGFRAPSLFEVSYNERPFGVFPLAAATALKEETSAGYDIGVEYQSAAGWRVEATYFDQEIEDKIDYTFDPDTFEDGYVQISGISESRGFELAANVPIGERYELIANWTDNDAQTVTNDPRVRRPKTLANLGLQYSSAENRLRLIANYRISKDAIDRFSEPLPDYEVLDVSMTYSLNDMIDVHARVENLTDEDYQEAIGFNTPGRTAYAGVRLRF